MNRYDWPETLATGIMRPQKVPVERLSAGEVGYFIGNIKSVADARVGDTITSVKRPAKKALPGYSEAKPMVYCGLFPTDSDQYEAGIWGLGDRRDGDLGLDIVGVSIMDWGIGDYRAGDWGLVTGMGQVVPARTACTFNSTS